MARVVVTGAAGFVGSRLAERLLCGGHEVGGVDAFTRFYARCAKERTVALLRAAPGVQLRERNNVRATEALLRAAAWADVRRVVLAS